MNKIVQPTDYEYQQLKKEADMTCATMEAEIMRGIEEHSKLSVDLKLDVGRDWDDVFHIKPVVYVSSSYYDPGQGDDKVKHAVSYEACRKIQGHIEKWMEEQIRKRYKLDIDTVNRYNHRMNTQVRWNVAYAIIALSGWLVACLSIFL